MRVLVVEDEPRMASVIRRGLQDEGYAVDVSGDAADAQWRATEVSYDAIVLDVMLPGGDGFSVCRALRDGGCWAPVLMLTARDAVADRIAGLDAGADDYLTKPFSLGELTARIRALLRRGATERPTKLTAGSLVLDPGERRVWRGDTEIRMTTREFALLEFLMRNPGQVLSRTRVLEGSWDQGLEAESNIVDQYVAYVRRKVDRPFGVEQIETVRGAGYRLLPQERPATT